jgi:POT family proton-dependent oligopeptide transporter
MTGSATIGGEIVDPAAALQNYMDVYQSAGLYSIAAGLLTLALVPIIKHYMHSS